jgi:serine/threonine protein phosphatase PrpC
MPQGESDESRDGRVASTTHREQRPHGRFTIVWGARSHQGFVRSSNEDCFFVGRFDRTLEPMLTNLSGASTPGWHCDAGYAVVIADGMGGAAAGDIASQSAVATLLELTVDAPEWIMRYDDPSLVAEVTERIESRMQQVDELLKRLGRSQPTLAGLGTTVTILTLIPPYGVLAHVGDSRAYLLRSGTLRQLTRDHTVAQVLADAGAIDAGSLSRHPTRSVLTRAVGHGKDRLAVDFERLEVAHGDQVVLCTDGLTALVRDAEIAGVLTSATSAATACDALVNLALERGGHDNVTVIAGRVFETSLESTG